MPTPVVRPASPPNKPGPDRRNPRRFSVFSRVMNNPEDLSDDELLEMLTPRQLAELDRAIAEMMGPEGLDKVISLQVMAQLYTVRAAERDETSALAMLQMAAAMRRRAEILAAAKG
ncbi:hypothetical protein GCM10010983_00670 [Caulobacter rhizosphaerae]|nr:hypothetical protein GCM10010983_00670 [Caulobacter rhizosphaerae]